MGSQGNGPPVRALILPMNYRPTFSRCVAFAIALTLSVVSYGSEAAPQKKQQKSRAKVSKKIAAAPLSPAYASHPAAQAFIADMVREHGFDANALSALFAKVRRNDRVIELMDAPMRRPAMWFEYIPRFTTEERVAAGVVFAREHKALLQKAETKYGVPAHVIVSIIGVETFYGRVTGGFSVLDALATLAFDYPRRADFFRGELKSFLLLNRSTPNVALEAKGSYAGAMGLPQFMPGSYRNYAVDFDEDGRIDLWGSPADIIGSVGEYFVRHGWQPGQPVWSEIVGIDAGKLPPIDGGLSLRQPVRAFAELGLPVAVGVNAGNEVASEAAVLLLEERDGPRYYLAYNNWYVITRYNRSRLYASAVWTLAEEIRMRVEKNQ
jgi:membrane-bound lytic murein transglycosylase B